jgi:AcrR family transcriptional regulator
MPAKKEKLKEFHRKNIIETAKALFAERGIDRTSMDDIAKKAEYSKTTLYAYFKSKDEIFNHITFEQITRLKVIVEGALSENTNFPDGYYAVCNAIAAFYGECPVYFESILGEIKIPQSQGESESILAEVYKVGEELNAIIESYIKTHTVSGRIRLGVSPLQTTFTLWSALSGIITMAHKKELYLDKAMNITKEQFMQDGFEMLLKCICQ